MSKLKKVFSTSGNLKYKLRIAFCLMSVLPLLVAIYLISNYFLPKVGFQLDTTVVLSIGISIFISLIGFFLIKEVFDRVVSISSEAKMIASGDVNRIVETGKEDEIGLLGDSLNQLTVQIRNSMDELKSYSERTTEINVEIQKRVLALSSLLQVSSLISQGLKLDDILKVIVEKSRLLANSDVSFLLYRNNESEDFFVRAADGTDMADLMQLKIRQDDPVFKNLTKSNKPLILDEETAVSDNLKLSLYDKFRAKNLLSLPIFLKGKLAGILSIGNAKEDFIYKKEDMELLDIFAKQIAIAVENDLLSRWVEKLEIKDSLTGLYNISFIRNRLQEEIKRAMIYQRPCSFILLNIDNFKKFNETFGLLVAETVLKKVAVLIRESIAEIDRAARTGDNEFAIVLPEKNKRHARDMADEIRRKIEAGFSDNEDPDKRITVSGGVSENPLDGITADELFNKAKELVDVAKSKGQNRILCQ